MGIYCRRKLIYKQHLRPVCCCDLDLDPMTFIYELDSYSLEIHRMLYFLRQGFRKLSFDRQTDRQTDNRQMPPKLYITRVVKKYKRATARRSLSHTKSFNRRHPQYATKLVWVVVILTLRYVTSRVLQTLTVTGRQAPWRSTVPELEQTFVFV